MTRVAGLLCGLALAASVSAAEPPRWQLRHATVVPGSADARFQLRGRPTPSASDVGLHEGERFVVVGRIAKAGSGCSGPILLRDGLEG